MVRFSGIRDFGIRNFLVVMAFLVVATGALFALSLNSASAGGDGGKKVAEATFQINVEPIKVDFNVTGGNPYLMRPGDTATIEVKITNFSTSTDWAVEVAITPNFGGTLSTIASYWEDRAKLRPGEWVVVPAGSIKTLSAQIYALDGAGTEDISISVHRFKLGGLG